MFFLQYLGYLKLNLPFQISLTIKSSTYCHNVIEFRSIPHRCSCELGRAVAVVGLCTIACIYVQLQVELEQPARQIMAKRRSTARREYGDINITIGAIFFNFINWTIIIESCFPFRFASSYISWGLSDLLAPATIPRSSVCRCSTCNHEL